MRIKQCVYLNCGETLESKHIDLDGWEEKPNANAGRRYYPDGTFKDHKKYSFHKKYVKDHNAFVFILRSILGIVLTIPFGIGWCINDEFMSRLFSRRNVKIHILQEAPAAKTAEKVNNVVANGSTIASNPPPSAADDGREPITLPGKPAAKSEPESKPEPNISFDAMSDQFISKITRFEELTIHLEDFEKNYSASRADALTDEFIKLKTTETIDILQAMIKAKESETAQSIVQPLLNGYLELNKRIDERLEGIKAQKVAHTSNSPQAVRTPGKTPGITNMGNTCYLNAALQILFASKEFLNQLPKRAEDLPRLPDETVQKYTARCELYNVFLEIRDEWVKEKRDPNAIGAKVQKYRHTLFNKKALLGYFDEKGTESYIYSSGDFFTHFFTLIASYNLKIKTSVDNISKEDQHIVTEKVEPFFVFDLRAAGNIQERANSFGTPLNQIVPNDKDGRKIEKDGVTHPIKSFSETIKIVGEPPKFMIVYIGTGVDYSINPKTDEEVDFTKIFENPTANNRYRLVGFAQNHNGVHWTGVVKTQPGKWDYCDDSRTTEVKPTDRDFLRPAHYLIYEKI